MTVPVPKVEIAFSTQPNDSSPAWVDVTQYVVVADGVSLTHGRQDQYSQVQPASARLTLSNVDGRFTPGNVGSPYYPNVKKGRKIRVSVVDNGVTYYRFTGYVDEWPVVWADASATLATVSITATSRMARLGREASLPSIVEVEYFNDTPVAYYPLGDSTGSLSAGNIATTVQPSMTVTPFGGGSNGNITFGSAAGVPSSSATAASFTRVSSTAGAYLQATISGIVNTQAVSAEAWITASATQEMGIIQLDYGRTSLIMGTTSGGKLTATISSTALGSTTITSSATVTDGLMHQVIVEISTGGTFSLTIDGTTDVGTSIAISTYTFTRMVIGGGILNSAFAGTISNAAVFANGIHETNHYQAGSTGFAGERSDQRINRLAVYGGVPPWEISTEVGLSTSLLAQDTTGQIPLQLMQDVTSTENGVLFDAVDGKLTFQSRTHRYNQSSSLTLQGSNILPSLTPKLDDQGLVNDINASRTGGVTIHTVDTNSVNEYGLYHQDLSLLTTSDLEVFDAASWKVSLGATPTVAIPVVEVELAAATTAMKAAILGREISDRITLAGLPAQAPAPSMDFVIEGWTETIDTVSHRVAFNLSNAADAGVWQFDSAVYAVFDSTTRFGY